MSEVALCNILPRTHTSDLWVRSRAVALRLCYCPVLSLRCSCVFWTGTTMTVFTPSAASRVPPCVSVSVWGLTETKALFVFICSFSGLYQRLCANVNLMIAVLQLWNVALFIENNYICQVWSDRLTGALLLFFYWQAPVNTVTLVILYNKNMER